MNDKKGQFFCGRTKALNWLRRHVFDTGKDPYPSPVLLVHGDDGIGKSALVQQFLHAYAGSDGGHDAINFAWKGHMRITSIASFAQMLLRTGSSAFPGLEENRDLLHMDIKGPQQDSESGSGSVMGNTYTIDGSSRESGVQSGQIGGEEETILADVFISKLAGWLKSGKLGSGLELETLLRLIFVFDAFETYPTPVKSWLGHYLFPALEQDPGIPPMSFILTGSLPWDVSGQADYWQAHPGAFHQFQLDPLSRQECEEWLRAHRVQISLLDTIYEETEGYPARINQVINDKNYLEQRKSAAAESDNPLSQFSAQERRWLHAASMQKGLTLEALQLLLGRIEGTQAFGWLSRHIEFCQVERDSRNEHLLVLSGEMRNLVLRNMTPKVPARHREFMAKVDLMKEIQSKVESVQHRDNLRVLTPLQPFTSDLIREVFQNEA
ncbi:MAG: AAA family ATPase [Puniceicoccaceae bacterium]